VDVGHAGDSLGKEWRGFLRASTLPYQRSEEDGRRVTIVTCRGVNGKRRDSTVVVVSMNE
jgi:hypothetical protein